MVELQPVSPRINHKPKVYLGDICQHIHVAKLGAVPSENHPPVPPSIRSVRISGHILKHDPPSHVYCWRARERRFNGLKPVLALEAFRVFL